MKIFGSKKFIKYAFLLAIPSMIQQMVTSFAQLIDNVMVGGLGDEAIAAVGIANQTTFIFMFIIFGLCSTCGIFISQYLGAENEEKIRQSFRINIVLSLVIGIVAFILVNVFTVQIIDLFVNDSQSTVDLGVSYLRSVSATFILFPLITTYSFGFRSEGNPKYSLIMGMCAVAVNTFLNYCLIYGNLGFNEYGVEGAAYATVVARIVELTVALIISKLLKSHIYTKVTDLFKFEKKLLYSIIDKGKILVLNEIIWSGAIVLSNIFFSYKLANNIAALQINGTVQSIAYIGSGGLATAVGVIVGKELGKNNLEEAKKDSIYLIRISGVVGAVMSVVLLIISQTLPSFYNITDEVASMAELLIIIGAISLPIRYMEMSAFFVVRSGGDTKGIFIMDSGYQLVFMLPVMLALYATSFTMIPRFIIGQILMLPRLVITYWIYRKETWKRNITV